MPIENALARVTAIQALVQKLAGEPPATTPAVTGSFGTVLQQTLDQSARSSSLAGLSPEQTGTVVASPELRSLSASGATPVVSSVPWGSPGQRALAAAQAEIGVREEPPGSNDASRIAEYRTAVRGSAPGVPWCAYFVSWAAARAGSPVGEEGQGYGAVEDVEAWARRTGRLLPDGWLPQPGDLILFGGRHIGIVESVQPDGRLVTVEGNHRDAVERVERSSAEATGFVRL